MTGYRTRRRSFLAGALALAASRVTATSHDPVLVGVDAEFGLDNSTSAQAIELGLRAAILEINDAGGVLQGRPVQLVVRDNRSIPARGIRNLEELAAMPDLVAVFGGRFSPVVIEQLPKLSDAGMPFMVPWSSADAIVDNGMQPNYIFRLSLRDSLAMPALLGAALERGLPKVGLLLTNTSWGRSNFSAANAFAARSRKLRIVRTVWYNWREQTLLAKYQELRAAGAQAIVLVANDDEAAVLVREVAALAPAERLPLLSHWGVSGGEFAKEAGPALQQVDLSVIQTFNFFNADPGQVQRLLATLSRISPVRRIADIKAPVGVAHAYDLMHILAKAVSLAGSTDRGAVRNALEKVGSHRGLVRHYAPPFTPQRHEALGPKELLLARYSADGVLVPAGRKD